MYRFDYLGIWEVGKHFFYDSNADPIKTYFSVQFTPSTEIVL